MLPRILIIPTSDQPPPPVMTNPHLALITENWEMFYKTFISIKFEQQDGGIILQLGWTQVISCIHVSWTEFNSLL